MIKAVFNIREGKPYGFTVTGHSGFGEAGRDIVCAAVSSAVYMAVNTVTEILGCEAESDVKDGYMKILLCGESSAASDIFDGLLLHLRELSEEYPDFIRISTEV